MKANTIKEQITLHKMKTETAKAKTINIEPSILGKIQQRLSNEYKRLGISPTKTKGFNIPIQWTADLFIDELKELSNYPEFNQTQKQYFKQKIELYYQSQEEFGQGRALLQIDGRLNVIIWID